MEYVLTLFMARARRNSKDPSASELVVETVTCTSPHIMVILDKMRELYTDKDLRNLIVSSQICLKSDKETTVYEY